MKLKPAKCHPEKEVHYKGKCKKCYDAEIYLKHKAHHKKLNRIAHLRRTFNLTEEEYDHMFKQQTGLCLICDRTSPQENLMIDHDHTTGKIRGLLCRRCNLLLGYAGDSPDILQRAERYLRSNG